MTNNKQKILIGVICLLVGIGIGWLGSYYGEETTLSNLLSEELEPGVKPGETNKPPEPSGKEKISSKMTAIAEEHLHKYNLLPPEVTKTEIQEGECEANKYWENWGQPPIEAPAKHQCWIVKFYYPGPAEGSYLAVYIDKETNEVIGGTQTR